MKTAEETLNEYLSGEFLNDNSDDGGLWIKEEVLKAMEDYANQFRPISVTEEERLELHFLEEEFFLEHWITEMDLKGLTAMSNKMTQRLQWVKGQVKPMTPGKENNQLK